ncbi:lysylphosphatidylglycerol synthase transmembrane domain-containing protein [Lunatimonas lonarensis]|uniref:lysylphosphatidylglycerol synthase transmembrane domain-containing protein n=1 Tax=Lunatimonas lonarensis TaxID=1232681 RepID=UPI000569BBDC|nr:lysylphosphatidylglycerol synthase transmembrane domain-containing protein [Lunatimonas lonarensis]
MNSKPVKLLIKLLLTAVAVFLVLSKIDSQTTWKVISGADWSWLGLAFVFFVASKIFCAFRLNGYFRDIGVYMPEWQNIKLYAIGMFYNLFLPGGIGGDGYKVYLLKRRFQTPVKQLLQAVVLDRGNGLAVLVFLLFALMAVVEVEWPFPLSQSLVGSLGMVLVTVGLYLTMILFFKAFMGSIVSTTVYSALNQILQLFSAFFILRSLGIQDRETTYLLVFLISSIVSVLPLTIGGVGARELVFVYAHGYVGIDKNAAVAFSVVFFVIAAITSLSGIFFKFDREVSIREEGN